MKYMDSGIDSGVRAGYPIMRAVRWTIFVDGFKDRFILQYFERQSRKTRSPTAAAGSLAF